MKFNPSQSEAICHRDGPAMIIAGPGSGKTTVITHRLEHMIRVLNIDPSSILVITFSRAAAKEMRERFFLLMGSQPHSVTFGTFHAIFFHILKCSYGYTAKQVAGAGRQAQFVREYIHRLRVECTDEADLIREILREISLVKNGCLDLRNYRPVSCEEEVFWTICSAYREFLRQNRLLDFDDMLILTRDLFMQRKDILEGWQKKFRYILIDEFQDINLLQYQIIRMLALPENNFFIVGDDDQSIYRFRGARPEIMLQFKQDYPNTKQILLGTNYRSGPEIVNAAGNLISFNSKRFPKKILAAPASVRAPVTELFSTQVLQNQYVIQTIRSLHDISGIPYDEMAVLFRTNDQPALLIHQLFEANIPFISRVHLPCVFDHWIAEDICTYLRLGTGKRDRAAFLRIMNRPNRFLSRESLPYESVSFELWAEYYDGQEEALMQIKKLERDIHMLKNLSPYSAANYVRKAIGYDDFLKAYANAHQIKAEDLLGVADEIQEDARGFETFEGWSAHMEKIRKEWAKRHAEGSLPSNSVSLSTFHAAKGLEFDTVFIVDVNEGVIPYKKAILPGDLEEERRLFYVGMTRAKRRLFLLHSAKIRNKTQAPSRFLNECAKKQP